MYQWIVFLHLLGAFGFVLTHGASASVAFRLRSERSLERIRALLDLSTAYMGAMYLALLVLLAAGIAAGFVGQWWGRGWIWAALGLLIAMMAAMFAYGTLYYSRVRRAAGMEFMENMKPHPPMEPASAEEMEALLARSPAALLAVVGFGGLAVMLWLMMFKPF